MEPAGRAEPERKVGDLMNDIQNTWNKTPIEIALGVDENGMTTARKLYEFLELRADNFSRWCKTNITQNEFATENEDYFRLVFDDETPTGGKIQREDFKLTAHFAKKLSMKGSGEKAEQAREYFTRLEEKTKELAIDRSQLSPKMQLMNMLVENMSRQELEQKRQAEEQKRQAEQLNRIEQKQEVMQDTFSKTDGVEDFQKWANDRIAQIAESPGFGKGESRSRNYSLARAESYERLKKKRNCHLDDRVQRAIGRALKERPDIKKSELQKINKLYVIANDRDLKPAYELVIKEMMIAYCVEAK